MHKRSSAWSDEPRFAHTQHMVEVCPPELMPTVQQNMATGGLSIEWPDVCHCHQNGGPTHEVHAISDTCPTCVDEAGDIIESHYCSCDPAATPRIVDGHHYHAEVCPLNHCPLGQCHPMCSQVTGDANEVYCYCPCHG